MSTKAEKIKWMIEQQKKFLEFERANGINGGDFFDPKDDEMGKFIAEYREQYHNTAVEVMNFAHDDKGSKAFY